MDQRSKTAFFSYKTSENLIQFKSLMKNWNDNSCSWTVGTNLVIH